MADAFTGKAVSFIERTKTSRFSCTSRPTIRTFRACPIRVSQARPRLGPRGDAIAQADWCVGEILRTLDRLNLARTPWSSSRATTAPSLTMGTRTTPWRSWATHRPAGPYRGGKYSNFEGGHARALDRQVARPRDPGNFDALVSQVDLLGFLCCADRPAAGLDRCARQLRHDACASWHVKVRTHRVGRGSRGPVAAARKLEIHRAEQQAEGQQGIRTSSSATTPHRSSTI